MVVSGGGPEASIDVLVLQVHGQVLTWMQSSTVGLLSEQRKVVGRAAERLIWK